MVKYHPTIIVFWLIQGIKKDISCYQNYSLRNKGVCPVATYYLAPFSFSFQHVWLLLTDYWPRIDIEEQQEWWKFAHSFVLTMNREMSLLPVNDDRFHFFTRKVQNFWVYIRQSTIIINFPISCGYIVGYLINSLICNSFNLWIWKSNKMKRTTLIQILLHLYNYKRQWPKTRKAIKSTIINTHKCSHWDNRFQTNVNK